MNALDAIARRAISREALAEYGRKAGKPVDHLLAAYDEAAAQGRNPVILWQPETGLVDIVTTGPETMGS